MPDDPVSFSSSEAQPDSTAGAVASFSSNEAQPDNTPQNPNAAPDMSKVAGATPGTTQPTAQPKVAMQPRSLGSTLPSAPDGRQSNPYQPAMSEADRAWLAPHETEALGDISGVSDIGKGLMDAGVQSPYPGTPKTPVNPQQGMKGATELMSGAGKLATPFIPEEFAAASALGKIKIAGGFMAGGALSEAGGAMLDHTDLQPETKDFIKSALFFVPSAAGLAFEMVAKPTITSTVLPDGSQGVEYSAFGGKVKGQAATTPEAVGVKGSVGPFSASVVKPRGGDVQFSAEGSPKLPGAQEGPVAPQQPPSPSTMMAQEEAASAAQAMSTASATDQAAANVVAGIRPPQKAQPQAMQTGSITPEIGNAVAKVIALTPPQDRGAAMQEAHTNLAQWITQQPGGRFVGPDGKIQIAETPQKAATIAMKLLNDEVDRHQQMAEDAQKQQEDALKAQQKAQDDAQKAQEQAAKDAEKAANTKNENGLTPAEQMQARVKTILDPLDGKPDGVKAAALVKQLRMPFHQALAAVQQHTASGLTVGSKQEPVTEESKATVDAQLDALKAGTVHTVMLPEGSKYQPAIPEGMKVVDIPASQPGAGRYIFNPKLIKVGTIRTAAKAGTHGDLLGHIETKEDIANAPQHTVVQAQAPDGTPIQDSAVSKPENVMPQAQILSERHPGSTIVQKHPQQVIDERHRSQTGKEKPQGPYRLVPAEPKDVAKGADHTGTSKIRDANGIDWAIGDTESMQKKADRYNAKEGFKPVEFKGSEVEQEPVASFTSDEVEKEEAAHESPLDKFEAEGKEPWQITRKEWVDIQRGHRRSIGQSEESGTRHAPYSDYEEYHREAVESALKAGKDVPPEVRKELESKTPKGGRGESPEPEPGGETRPLSEQIELTPMAADVPTFDQLLSKRGSAPLNLIAPDAGSIEKFLRNNRIPVPKSAKDQRQLVTNIAKERYDVAVQTVRNLPNEITVFRSVGVVPGAGTQGLRTDNLGAFWSDKESGAKSYWATREGSRNLILRGTARSSQVDTGQTILARMRGHGSEEGEITLKPGENPSGVEYKQEGSDTWEPLSPPLSEQGVEATQTAAKAHGLEITSQQAEEDIAAQKSQAKMLVEVIGEEAARKYSQENPEQADIITRTLAEISSEKKAPDVQSGSNSENAVGSQPEKPGVAGSVSQGDGAGGAGREVSGAGGALQPGSVAKGDAIRYTDRDGVERTGTVAAKTGLGVRIKETGHFVQTRKILAVEGKAEHPIEDGNADTTERGFSGPQGEDRKPAASQQSGEVQTPARSGRPEPAPREGSPGGLEDNGERAGLHEPRPAEGTGSRALEPSDAGAGEGTAAGDERGGSGQQLDPASVKETQKRVSRELKNKNNYRIDIEQLPDPSTIAAGGEITRIKGNIAAIKLVKELMAADRGATPAQQQVLAQYVGWGALSKIFDNYRYEMREHYEALKDILTPQEYDAARKSVLNAHYTSPEVIASMWKLARRLGFTGGPMIEPSMGVGHFFGLMPKEMSGRSDMLGVELDTITGNIARLLYPDAQVAVKGYQNVTLPDNSMSFAVGNVPFGDIRISDSRYKNPSLAIHDYFFAKTLDKLKPGGIMSLITSRYTLDKKDPTFRRYLAERADLVGAIRLPDSAFKKNAGTEVVTDIVTLRKRYPGEAQKGEPFENLSALGGDLPEINEYFVRHPEHVMGQHALTGKMYGAKGYNVELKDGDKLADKLAAAVETFPRRVWNPDQDQNHGERLAMLNAHIMAPSTVKEGAFVVHEGKVVRNEGGLLRALPDELASKAGRIKSLIGVRDAAKALIRAQVSERDDDVVSGFRKELNKLYDSYTKAHGYLNGNGTSSVFESDPDYPMLEALENYDPKAKAGSKTPIFKERTARPYEPLNKATFPKDTKAGFAQILSAVGRPDIQLQAQLMDKTQEEVASELTKDGLIFMDPDSGSYVSRSLYLSGNVREKLKQAKSAAQLAPRFQGNVDNLEKVQPKDLTIHEIRLKPGQSWIPNNVYEGFLRHLSGGGQRYGSSISITRSQDDKQSWQVEMRGIDEFKLKNEWGGGGLNGDDLFKLLLNQKIPTIRYKDSEGKVHIDVDRTSQAREMQQKIRDEFDAWAQENQKVGDLLAGIYNEKINNLALRTDDGSHLQFPGMATQMGGKPFAMKAHQVNWAWRTIQDGRGIAAHEVGAGKTFEAIAAGMEMRRMNLSPKNVYSVPKNKVSDWRDDFARLYPGSNVLSMGEGDFTPQRRPVVMSRIATGNYDAVIISHDNLGQMPMTPEYEARHLESQLAEMRDALESSEDQRTRKQIEKAIAKKEERIIALRGDSARKDKTLHFDELGITSLFVDEAHNFKNLSFYTGMGQIAGIQSTPSQRAEDLAMKAKYLREQNGGRGVIFLTATPVTNAIAELYNMTRFVAPDILSDAGINTFDDWAANYGEVKNDLEFAVDGVTLRAKSRFTRFANVPELGTQFSSFADVKTGEDLPDIIKPRVNKRNVEVTLNANQEAGLDDIAKRGEALNQKKPWDIDGKEDNWLWLSSHARAISIDARLFGDELDHETDQQSKAAAVAQEVHGIYKQTMADKGTQLVFSDIFRNAKNGFNLFEDVRDRLVKLGIPKEEIAATDEKRFQNSNAWDQLQQNVRDGNVRVLMGTTKRMGEGINVQTRMRALHHLDQPWTPKDMTQREGRAVRQGNLYPEVDIVRYYSKPRPGKVEKYDPQTGKVTLVDRPKAFDVQMFQKLEQKAFFLNQLMSGHMTDRTMEDPAGAVTIDYSMLKANASGDPNVLKKVQITNDLNRLASLQRAWAATQRNTVYAVGQRQQTIAFEQQNIAADQKLKEAWEKTDNGKNFSVVVDKKKFTGKAEAAEYLESRNDLKAGEPLEIYGVPVSIFDYDHYNNGQVKTYYSIAPGQQAVMPDTKAGIIASVSYHLRNAESEIEREQGHIAKLNSEIGDLQKKGREGDPYAKDIREQKAELATTNVALGLNPDGSLRREDDADVIADQSEDEEKPSSGTTLHASVFGLDILARFMADQGKKFYDTDLAPAIQKVGSTGKRAGVELAHVLYPRFGANEDALDAIMKAKGDRERTRFKLEQKTVDGLGISMLRFFEKMSPEQHLAFIDRYKLGQGQPDPRLQQIEDLMRAIDDATLQQAQKYNPSLQAKEDHFRVFWKVIPGKTANQQPKRGPNPNARRPFEGDKGFMKRSTLDTISEGINYGGVPVTTNPWKLFSMAQSSMMNFITARRYWASLKPLGMRKFVKLGQQAPEGWLKVPDKIATVYFPAASGEGMVKSGEWYVEPSAGRLLVNFLSKDHIRENAIGNTLMMAKNLSTAIELSLSPFHLIFESIEAMGSQFGLGVQRFWNNGMREGDVGEMVKGAKDASTFMAAPVLMAREGGSLLRAGRNFHDFAQTARGAAFLKRFPNAAQILNDYFTGGGQFSMNPDYRFDPAKSMTEAAKNGEYIGAMLRAFPALNHWIMSPLFEHYIPRLKMGMFLQQYSQQLHEQRDELANGDVTEATIARQVNDSVENRFGELNFSNIFWDNTFKSALQFLFRSVTWKLGNWRGLTTAATREAGTALLDPLKAMYEDARAGKKSHATKDYIPKLGMNQAWLLGMAMTTAVLGTVLSKLLAGRYPWEMAAEDKAAGYGPMGALALELTHPRTGKFDPHTGKPDRVSLPTGLKDFEHAFTRPASYLRGSMSEIAGRFIDTAENRDFFNDYVYDPNAPLYRQFAQVLTYAAPKPISLQQMTSGSGSQDTKSKAIRALGLTGASKDLDMSKAEQKLRAINRAEHVPLTPEQKTEKAAERENGETRPSPMQLRRAMREKNLDYLQRLFKAASYADAMDVYNHAASPAEQRILRPLLAEKRANILRKDPNRARSLAVQ